MSSGIHLRETILVVDDDATLRKFVCLVLQKHSYTLLEAPDGPSAIHIYEGHPQRINLLLTNVLMPGMSGRELAERVTAQWPWTRILYMSGGVDSALFQGFELESKGKFLPKPFGVDLLIQKVREVLDRPLEIF